MILACTGCGETKPEPTDDPTDLHPAARCGQCPPWRCEVCEEMSSAVALCSCWTGFAGLSFAETKGLLARAGLSLAAPVART